MYKHLCKQAWPPASVALAAQVKFGVWPVMGNADIKDQFEKLKEDSEALQSLNEAQHPEYKHDKHVL